MKKTIKDYEYKGKRVILRCDLNVPIEDNIITDETKECNHYYECKKNRSYSKRQEKRRATFG